MSPAQAAKMRLGQSSYKRFLDLSCNIDKSLFLGNNAPQSPLSSFNRISSEFLQKSLQKHINASMSFKIACFNQKRRFRALFCVVFVFVIFAEKVRFLRQKRTFSLTFLCLLRFAKNGAQTRRFCLFMPFCLCLRRSLQ